MRTNATTGELIEAWFDHAAGDFSPKTVKETRGFIDRNLLPAIGGVPLSKLKASDLDRLYRRLLAAGAVGGGGLAPATVRRIHGILRRALAQGVKWGWFGVNPAAATTPPRVPQPEISPPSGRDLARVLRRAWDASPELACFLVVAAATGARRSELVALRWRDVDLGDGTVRIERGVVMGPDGLVEKNTKTHAARRVALDDGTVQTVEAHRARMAERATMCRVALSDDSFVFSNAGDCSEPWFPDSVSRGFKRLCVAEALTDVRLHDLRHFVASQLLSAGRRCAYRRRSSRTPQRRDDAERLRPLPGTGRSRCGGRHRPSDRRRAGWGRSAGPVRQPIERLIREEPPPDDSVVVVRGGPLTAQKIVEHAVRQHAVFTYRGVPMIAISIDLAIEGWSVERILRDRMWSRSRYATTTVGELRSAGYELVATSSAPHYSVVLPAASEAAATALLEHFGPTLANEFKQRRK